ncbi:hypothetical protein V5F89_07910 [Pelagerythrobacter marensis]|uniref:Uncharacterized protein n=1 Tax=Pelagerythrobacter marensis TaxID=543877 RepID=A0ABZ2D1J0_9SPHN
MNPHFDNRLDWIALGGAFTVWTAHFMAAWSIGSILPGRPIVLWLTLAITIAALAALAGLWRWRRVRSPVSVAGLAIALAALGVLYDFLPALMA